MRSVRRIIKSIEAHEGAGFIVHRPFPVEDLSGIDPFLLIDNVGPHQFKPGEAKGAPDHPHRGLETITYILEGSMVHEDSEGGRSELESGDIQWMTAGKGIVHSEMPHTRLLREGGAFHAIQIWLNLPKNLKLTPPSYQNLQSNLIPVITPSAGFSLKIISGQMFGKRGLAKTLWPMLYAHGKLEAGINCSIGGLSSEQTLLIFVLKGNLAFGDSLAHKDDLAHFNNEAGDIEISNPCSQVDAEFLILSSPPICETVARMGPFVMNTDEELQSAYDDYLAGRFGHIVRK